MKQEMRQLRGYTILEMLIATAIFAIVMVMATSVVAQSVSYQSKIKAMRVTSTEARKTADFINSTIRQANIPGTVTTDTFDPTAYIYKSGVALFDCQYSSSKCTPRHTGLISDQETIYSGDIYSGGDTLDASKYRANTLVVFWNDGGTDRYRIIYTFTDKRILVIDGSGNSISPNLLNVIGSKIIDAQYDPTFVKWDAITLSGRYPATSSAQVIQTDSVVAFGGVAPKDPGDSTDKTYVLYDVFVKTRDNGAVRAADRASLHIRSAVTTRDF